ncbi:hypothetical protein PYH37_004803 [Sinorhizobium numidicum]|uniref:Uncharacterized protein n=1 Tax=Sinorhizobium numidicum TaxID=680248 RepID=A0ABY8D0H0_9HYPH|nr:hypothetical protein [Sinorhizobium numidicum]WEX76492.1 hypothetical protein PYH37_004803 [Sinorhizobium numidicum]WEX83153.1 hypothetical protein PYH38_005515 [Sinorhizobium numidicum]
MKHGTVDETKATVERLRPLVVVVVAAKLAISALLLTTVQYSPPVAAPEIAALR